MKTKSIFLSLLGLTTFAIAKPVLEPLSTGATFFVAHGATAVYVLCFALGTFIIPPLVLTACVLPLKVFSDRLATLVACVLLGILAGLWLASSTTSFQAPLSLSMALACAALVGFGVFRFSLFRDFLDWLGIASPLVILAILLFSPVNGILFPGESKEVQGHALTDTPIVFLLFDELSLAALTTPDGNIDAQRLPNFSRLENMSTWYFDTTTVSTSTATAVPAILTGKRTSRDIPAIHSEYPSNLFTTFEPTHDLFVLEHITRICPEKVCQNTSQSGNGASKLVSMYHDAWILWQHSVYPTEIAVRFLPSIAAKWANFDRDAPYAGTANVASANANATDVLRDLTGKLIRNPQTQFDRFLSALRRSDGPSLHYLHLSVPHTPWIYLPDGTTYNGRNIAGLFWMTWVDDQHFVDQAILRYALQVEYVDLLLGKTLDTLEETGRLHRSMLIVVSDHGAAFVPHKNRRIPTPETLAELSRVPLFIKYPDQTTAIRDERKVETIDILPTIATVAKVELAHDIDGQPLVGNNWRPRTRHLHEAQKKQNDLGAPMTLSQASSRFYNVLRPGSSALAAIGFASNIYDIGETTPRNISPLADVTLQVHSQDCFRNVVADGKYLPAHISGFLEGEDASRMLWISLNGKFAGNGFSGPFRGQVSIMLDPGLFVDGANSIGAYIQDGEQLVEIPVQCNTENPGGRAIKFAE